MKIESKARKKAMNGFRQTSEPELLRQRMHEIIQQGTAALNETMLGIGRQVAETILYLEREELAGPDYAPSRPGVYKWAAEPGSIYLGDQKVTVARPRLRGPNGELALRSYQALKQPRGFSEQLLGQALRGLSGRQYEQTVVNAAEAFGVSPSSVSRHLVTASAQKLKEFKERDLSDFKPFAIFLDTVHRGGRAFVVAVGLDQTGRKQALGFWEGASENHEVAQLLLVDLEQRGLKLSAQVLWITDGGSGLLKALRERYGKKLAHQRCTIHKDRNIQAHLPKRHRKEAHRRFRVALEQNEYKEAEKMLRELEKWLRGINESAADSLLEAFAELLTLHRLKVPAVLRKALHSTNVIESVFSRVRACEKNIKRYRSSSMAQRWLASVLLLAEQSFRTVTGHEHIATVLANIEAQNAQ
jgi:transposase-like protein